MGLNTKLRISLIQKLKLLGKDSKFVFKLKNFFYPIRYENILTYEQVAYIILNSYHNFEILVYTRRDQVKSL